MFRTVSKSETETWGVKDAGDQITGDQMSHEITYKSSFYYTPYHKHDE